MINKNIVSTPYIYINIYSYISRPKFSCCGTNKGTSYLIVRPISSPFHHSYLRLDKVDYFSLYHPHSFDLKRWYQLFKAIKYFNIFVFYYIFINILIAVLLLLRPYGNVTGSVRGPPESVPWIFEQYLALHPTIHIFQFRQRWWSDWQRVCVAKKKNHKMKTTGNPVLNTPQSVENKDPMWSHRSRRPTARLQ